MNEFIKEWGLLGLAIIQGFSEIFPISSSGHLVIFSELFRIPITFNAAVFFHAGTFMAILVKYRAQVWGLVRGKFGWRLLFYISISCFTTLLVGLVVKQIADIIVTEQSRKVTLLLSLNGAMLMAIGLFSPSGKRSICDLRLWEFIIIGLIQGITAIPGISRLGLTLGIGLMLNLVWFDALDLSFVLSLPIIFFANVFTYLQVSGWLSWFPILAGEGATSIQVKGGILYTNPVIQIAVTMLVFFCGWISIRVLYKYLSRKLLFFFGFYCLFAGIFFFYFLNLV